MTIKDSMAASISRVLLNHWDPIGIADEPAAQDEYESYARVIASMIRAGAQTERIADYLLSVERDRMELPGDAGRSVRVAAELQTL